MAEEKAFWDRTKDGFKWLWDRTLKYRDESVVWFNKALSDFFAKGVDPRPFWMQILQWITGGFIKMDGGSMKKNPPDVWTLPRFLEGRFMDAVDLFDYLFPGGEKKDANKDKNKDKKDKKGALPTVSPTGLSTTIGDNAIGTEKSNNTEKGDNVEKSEESSVKEKLEEIKSTLKKNREEIEEDKSVKEDDLASEYSDIDDTASEISDITFIDTSEEGGKSPEGSISQNSDISELSLFNPTGTPKGGDNGSPETFFESPHSETSSNKSEDSSINPLDINLEEDEKSKSTIINWSNDSGGNDSQSRSEKSWTSKISSSRGSSNSSKDTDVRIRSTTIEI